MNSISAESTSHNPHLRVGNAPNTTASASASAAQSIAQIPRHILGTASEAAPAYIPALSDDPLSIVAGYLGESDRHVMRQVDTLMYQVVDPKIEILTVSAKEACTIFSQPHAFRALRELHLTECGNAELINLAAILKTLPHTRFDLILNRRDKTAVSAEGLNALTEITFSSITLRGPAITIDAVRSLARSASPISISLSDRHSFLEPNVYLCLRIPTLRSLHAGSRHILPSNISSEIAAHACLTELSVGEIASRAFLDIATSATIQSLSFGIIRDDEVAALTALADNPILRSLSIGLLRTPQSLAALARNSALRSVTLGITSDAQSGILHLANMPGLDVLTLKNVSAFNKRLRAEHVETLSAKPFESLSFHDWDIEAAAQSLIAATRSRHLSLDHATPFSDAAINVLSLNPVVASLSVNAKAITTAHAMTLAGSPTLQHLRVTTHTHFSAEAKLAIATAWRAADKPPTNLQLSPAGNTTTRER